MKIVKIVAVATGTLALGAVSNNANAADLFTVDHLGSGSEVRSNLIELNSDFIADNRMVSNLNVELKCGEGKCGEGKCGEGKSGDEKDSDKKEDAIKSDTKEDTKEETKEEAKEETEKDDKSKEGKCGN
ncbi:MAG: hypothetical protein ACJASM_001228 [Salibacteraceae bacterium]|jgi:hypothetical protein|tara:strand:+ start:493 stop:879 length:387 start_codon:yes stop_codon:yes gene_type:complete